LAYPGRYVDEGNGISEERETLGVRGKGEKPMPSVGTRDMSGERWKKKEKRERRQSLGREHADETKQNVSNSRDVGQKRTWISARFASVAARDDDDEKNGDHRE
jgi:hypothetical protein